MKTMRLSAICVWVAVMLLPLSGLTGILPWPPGMQAMAWAEEAWRAEFDDICGKTQDAMSLSVEELKSLSERCDRLKAHIDALDESQKKVYLKRLKMCKDLFEFVLKSKMTP